MKKLDAAFLVMGFSCSISQVLLAREFMTLFSGNELILGVLFVNWLLCIALGSWGLGRLADRPEGRLEWLVATLILIAIILPTQIVFVRSMGGWLVAERGEMPGLLSTFLSTFLALLPFCSLHGFQFSLGCRLYTEEANREGSPAQVSRVYVLEALGSVIGGLMFTYFLVHYLRVFEMNTWMSLLNLMLALILLGTERGFTNPSTSVRALTGVTVLLLVVGGFGALSGGIGGLDAASRRWQWEGLGLVHTENSVYGSIAVTQKGGQLDFWVNGLPLFMAPDPDILFVEEVVHFPLLQHPSPGRVLLIGGGLGGVLEEVLKHPVTSVTYVELDPKLFELTRRFSPESAGILDDPRVEVVHQDGRLFVKGTEGPFDVAIVNLPPPSTLQLNRFYTMEFFREIRRILEADGIISLGLPSSLSHMSKEMGNRNRCVYETLRRVFPSCLVVPGDYNLFLASPSSGGDRLDYDTDLLGQRLRDRAIGTTVVTEDYIRYKFSPERVEIGLAYLHQGGAEVNRDMRPVAVFHDLALWNTMFHPRARGIFALLLDADPRWLIPPLGLLTLGLYFVQRRRRLVGLPVYLAIFTTGFAGMTTSIIILYAFQTLYGYLYQELGVVTASFMLGVAVGGWLAGRRTTKGGRDVSTLYKTELAIIAYSLVTLCAVTALSGLVVGFYVFPLVRVFLPLMNCASGLLVGVEFPLASGIFLKESDRVAGVAGALYASDLFGACAGSLVASIWVIPLHGVLGACSAIAVLNVASFILFYSTKGRR